MTLDYISMSTCYTTLTDHVIVYTYK